MVEDGNRTHVNKVTIYHSATKLPPPPTFSPEIGLEPISIVLETIALPVELLQLSGAAHTENRTPINGLKDRCSNY